MIWGKTNDDRVNTSVKAIVWHKWFAWHPVTLDNGQFCWLETIERKGRSKYGNYPVEEIKDALLRGGNNTGILIWNYLYRRKL